MWLQNFSSRLESWNTLRDQCQDLPLDTALQNINEWWFNAPWRPYYLHWDDQLTWPDPWQLLSENIYCDLARGLGILYTITMLDRTDVTDANLVLTEQGYNLVLVNKSKYILNWESGSIVNNSPKLVIKRQYQKKQIL
jgi:hypothetical protein